MGHPIRDRMMVVDLGLVIKILGSMYILLTVLRPVSTMSCEDFALIPPGDLQLLQGTTETIGCQYPGASTVGYVWDGTPLNLIIPKPQGISISADDTLTITALPEHNGIVITCLATVYVSNTPMFCPSRPTTLHITNEQPLTVTVNPTITDPTISSTTFVDVATTFVDVATTFVDVATTHVKNGTEDTTPIIAIAVGIPVPVVVLVVVVVVFLAVMGRRHRCFRKSDGNDTTEELVEMQNVNQGPGQPLQPVGQSVTILDHRAVDNGLSSMEEDDLAGQLNLRCQPSVTPSVENSGDSGIGSKPTTAPAETSSQADPASEGEGEEEEERDNSFGYGQDEQLTVHVSDDYMEDTEDRATHAQDTDGARDTAADYMKDMMKSLPPMHSQPQGQPAAGSVPHQEGRLFLNEDVVTRPEQHFLTIANNDHPPDLVTTGL